MSDGAARATAASVVTQVQKPAIKELCFFSPFKRHLQRHRPSVPSSNWSLYVAAFAGPRVYQRVYATGGFAVRGLHGGGRGARRGGGGGFLRRRAREAAAAEAAASPGRRLGSVAEAAPYAAAPYAAAAAARCGAGGMQGFEACPFYLGEVAAARVLRAAFPALRVLAVLRSPRERTVSAFNDYVRVGRIRGRDASSAAGMEQLVRAKIAQLASGSAHAETFALRILTSGIYIHGLRAWGRHWPAAQLLLLRAEDVFADTPAEMARVQAFLRLRAPFEARALRTVRNRNPLASKARPSAALSAALDAFFAPHNEALYAWLAARGVPWTRWENATTAVAR